MTKVKKKSSFCSFPMFKKAVLAAKSLIEDKIAIIRVLSDANVSISLDEQRYDKKEIKEIKKDTLKSLLNTEIPAVITAVLRDNSYSWLSMILPGNEFNDAKSIEKKFEKKFEFVQKELITSQLKEQFLLKRISKNDILDELKWDIGYKCHDLKKGAVDRLQFATVSISCNKRGMGLSFLSLFGDKE